MTQFESKGNGYRTYYMNATLLNIDEFIKLERVAGLINEKLNHKIFFIFEMEGENVFQCLN